MTDLPTYYTFEELEEADVIALSKGRVPANVQVTAQRLLNPDYPFTIEPTQQIHFAAAQKRRSA